MTSSIQDVAKAAGVSISTVSRSFTRPDLVSAKTRKRVLEIANELNFSLSRSAAALKSGRSLRIAVLMSSHIVCGSPLRLSRGLTEVLHAEGYDISIFQISSIEERGEFFDTLQYATNADAVIVVSFDIDAQESAQLASVGVPIIGINAVKPENADSPQLSISMMSKAPHTCRPASYRAWAPQHRLYQHRPRRFPVLLRKEPFQRLLRLLPQEHRTADREVQRSTMTDTIRSATWSRS